LAAGDIANKGKREEYNEAATWFDELTSAVKCKKTKICVVPGNHDVDRTAIKVTAKTFHDRIRQNPLEADNILAELAEESPDNHPLLNPLTNYNVFAEQYGCSIGTPDQPYWMKPFRFVSGYAIEVVGMTSVLVSNSEDAAEKMVLGSSQYTLDQVDDREIFAMFHHPLCWLMDSDRAGDFLFSRSRAIITGHKHRQRIHMHSAMTGEQILMVESGAVTPPRGESGYGFVYNWLEFDLDVSDRNNPKIKVTVLPRHWSYDLTKFTAHTEATSFHISCPRLQNLFPGDRQPSQTTHVDMTQSDQLEEVRLMFWRLSNKDRLRILLALDLIPDSLSNSTLSLWEERAALRRAHSEEKLAEIRREIESIQQEEPT
jgi:predicted phosphodiesterase